jgi:hypothetical protein
MTSIAFRPARLAKRVWPTGGPAVKTLFQLDTTESERATLQEMLETC